MDLPEANEFRVTQTAPLTSREAEVLLWTAEGKTAWEAGQILGITEGTVRIHLAHVLDKLKAANKPHAVARGFLHGIIGRKLVIFLLVAASVTVRPDDAEAARMTRRPKTRETRVESLARCVRRF